MPHELPKSYDPTAIEDKWAEYWVREELFHQPEATAQAQPGKVGETAPHRDPFTILLPPPNVTGRLHMGHMLNQTEMDILARWRRMGGGTGAGTGVGTGAGRSEASYQALWVPGTDHAGIATQMMVERQLTEEGTSRQALGREAFLDRVWAWKKLYGGAILDQMKRLGASVDWGREYFTMDEDLSVAVREAFTRLYAQGLIYRGAYIVNWCPRCQTAISDLEVVHEEQAGKLWEIRYPVVGMPGEFLTIATTRPETMLGDVAVAVHSEDERYQRLHGKLLQLPLVGREIPIVLDEWVSREFGTGAVKVTPAHDANDFALGQRHKLPSINVMDDCGHINEAGGSYAGLDRYAARKRILEDLDTAGLLAAVREHKNSIGRCDRCKTVVEPRLSTQWFIRIQPLADRAIAAVEEGHIRFTPEQYKKTYLNWMTNIHDWCISRQLWWGHRIPAWFCGACGEITVPSPGDASSPESCAHCGSRDLTQETDVLDTWFSSGLLPISVFGWPDPTPDFHRFYPTSLLVTGFDILFFWVARMIMLGCWFSKDVPNADGSPRRAEDTVPFREVYIHALVRDANREKMSKTKGNVLDPIEIVGQYGTDAVRFTLAAMASPGTDIAFNVARTEGYRAFANKIWNAARFIFMNIERAAESGIRIDLERLGAMPLAAADAPLETRWILAQLHRTAAAVNQALEDYRYDEAASVIYQFFWGEFCDWYLEIAKLRMDFAGAPAAATATQQTIQTTQTTQTTQTLQTLVEVFEASLRLLSPFMPFLTEEIWHAIHAIYDGNPPARSIALTRYPVATNFVEDDSAAEAMRTLQEFITGLRAQRKERGVPEKETVAAEFAAADAQAALFAAQTPMIQALARVATLNRVEAAALATRAGTRHEAAWTLDVVYEKPIDPAAERERLTKEIARLDKAVQSAEKQLGNEAFLSRAPAAVVDGLKRQLAENSELLERARAAVAALAND